MRTPVLTIAILLIAAAAAGCIGNDPEPVDTATTPEDPVTTDDEQIEEPEPQDPEEPEEPEPQEEEPVEEEDVADEEETANGAPRIVELTATGSTTLAVGHPCDEGLETECASGDYADAKFEAIGAGARSATLVATWSATVPLPLPSYFEVYLADGTVIASGSGEGPVTIDIPTDGLAGELGVKAMPEWGSVHVDQTFDYVLTLEYP